MPLTEQRYRTIVADPPWLQMGGTLRGSGAGEGWQFPGKIGASKPLPYQTMSVKEIKDLPVPEIADLNSDLYLWTTNRYIEAAYEIARTWLFTPSTMLVWTKAPMGGGLGGKWGISTEFCLYARRGRGADRGRRISGTSFDFKRPYDERGKPRHSAKPPQFLDLVEQVSEGPYLELFARSQRLGWDTWGNEALGHVELGA
jgi:N6-adenosine-specific RNA methylase IME4